MDNSNISIHKRDNYIDMLKGIAVLLMIYGHIIDYGRLPNVCVTEQKAIFDYIYNFIYAFHMPLFFMISGYVMGIKDSKGSGKQIDYIINNVISLYIPYIFFAFAYWFERLIAVKMLRVDLVDPLESTFTEILGLLYNGKSATWFLLSLLLVKLIFSIVDRLAGIWWTSFFFIGIFFINIIYPCRFLYLISYGIYFVCGYIISTYIDKLSIIISKNSVRLLLVVIWIVSEMYVTLNGINNEFVKAIIALVLSSILILLKKPIKSNPFCFWGKDSMVVYIVHGLVNGLAIAFFTTVLCVKYNIKMTFMCFVIQVLMVTIVVWLNHTRAFNWLNYFFYPCKYLKMRT